MLAILLLLVILLLLSVLLLLVVLLLLTPLLLLAHGELGLGNTVCQDPSFSGIGDIGKGLVLSDHAGASKFVGIVAFDVGDVPFVS